MKKLTNLLDVFQILERKIGAASITEAKELKATFPSDRAAVGSCAQPAAMKATAVKMSVLMRLTPELSRTAKRLRLGRIVRRLSRATSGRGAATSGGARLGMPPKR